MIDTTFLRTKLSGITMTTVRSLRLPTLGWAAAAGRVLTALWVIAVTGQFALAQQPPTHWLHAGVMPPGAIGAQRLLRGGPLSCHVQPIELLVPEGASIEVASQGGFATPHADRQLVGLRLAQVYRMRVTGVPNYPETPVYPSVELIDRLYPPAGRELEFALPIELTSEELQLAAEGSFVTRVIYVEDPALALPVFQKEGQQWFEARQGDDPLVVADTLGRPIAILRIGSRAPSGWSEGPGCIEPPVEFYDNVPQTAEATSKEASLERLASHEEVWNGPSPSDCPAGCPAESCPTESCPASGCPVGGCDSCGPCVSCTGPTPRDEIVCDGGDAGPPVGVREDWSIDGLDQQDTVVHFDTLDGRVLVQPSNRVCLYAPRFGAVRRVVSAVADQQRIRLGAMVEDIQPVRADDVLEPSTTLQNLSPVAKIGQLPPGLLRQREQAGEFQARVVVREVVDLIKPYCELQVVKLGLVDNTEKAWLAKSALAALTWTGDQAAQVTIGGKSAQAFTSALQPGVIYSPQQPDPCIRLIKLASTDHAKPGEEVDFTLRFDNIGGQQVGNVTIVDNLSTRLEYVPNSAQASVEAAFSSSENGLGSLVLRWEIKAPVDPGKGGVLQFKARVR